MTTRLAMVDFPKALLKAAQTGRLVVFAGAGVSMGTPAKLPDFLTLAKDIGKGHINQPSDAHALDKYLGELVDEGVAVHARAAHLLDVPGETFTGLHKDIVRIFKSPENVRVVTTNFDRLFAGAHYSLWQTEAKTYVAPALPLGRNFKGIVHVHGEVGDEESLVLTDRDFGRAYLTDGWAQRFLVDLFKDNTVLFVGYSHEDPVMKYLARALPVTREAESRFVMEKANSNAPHWRSLGIVPVYYPSQSKGDYSGLYNSINALAEFTNRSVVGWASKLGKLGRSAPPSLANAEFEEKRDAIVSAFSDSVKAKYFLETAECEDWLTWLEDQGLLAGLFREATSLSDAEIELTWWIGKRGLAEYPHAVFALLSRNGLYVHPTFWGNLTYWVTEYSEKLSLQWLERFSSWLCFTIPRTDISPRFSMVGLNAIRRGLTRTGLEVFIKISQLRLRVANSGRENSFEPTLWYQSDSYELSAYWDRCGKELLAAHPEEILTTAVESLRVKHRFGALWKSSTIDADSWRRQLPGVFPMPGTYESIDAVITCTREALIRLVNSDECRIDLCESMSREASPILRRLSIYGMQNATLKTPAERLQWVLDRFNLFDLSVKVEVFDVLRATYPLVSTDLRGDVLRRIADQSEDSPNMTYAKYNVLTWLADVAPDDIELQAALRRLSEANPEFSPRTHPDRAWWSEALSPRSSPVAAEHFLSQSHAEVVSTLEHHLERCDSISMREALMEQFASAVAKDARWGGGVASALLSGKFSDSTVWPALIEGVKAWTKDEDLDDMTLEVFKNDEVVANATTSLSELLIAFRTYRGAAQGAILKKCDDIADALSKHFGSQGDDSVPINFPDAQPLYGSESSESKLCLYWLYRLERTRIEQGGAFTSASDPHLRRLELALSHSGKYGVIAQSVALRHVNFLWSVDEQWVRTHVTPLLLAENDQLFKFSWEALLSNGELEPTFLAEASSSLKDAVSRIKDWTSRERDGFLQSYCSTALLDERQLNEWLPRFFAIATEAERVMFAKRLSDYAKKSSNQVGIWEGWVKDYWLGRIAGIPVPLSPTEAGEMLALTLSFETVFSECVEVAAKMTACSVPQRFFRRLLKRGIIEKFPEPSVQLVIAALRGSGDYDWYELESVRDAFDKVALRSDLSQELCEKLASKGVL
jgi:hypothetical protein